MTKLLNLEKLKNKLPLQGHGTLVMLLPVVFFFAIAAIGQLPVTQAQEEEGQTGADTFEITVTAEPAEGGTVSGGGVYEEGTEAGLTAVANEGYLFSGWFEAGELINAEGELYFIVTGGHDLVARFGEYSSFEGDVLNSPVGSGPPGEEWTERTSGTDYSLRGVIWGDNQFVAVGNNGTILTSPDGLSWTAQTSSTSNNLNSVTWGNNQFVAVGDSNTILTSIDGVTWTTQSPGTTSPNLLSDITWGDVQFVAVSLSMGRALISPDGISWTVRTTGTDYSLRGVTWGDGHFVVVVNNGTIRTSPNGVNWTLRTTGATSPLHGVTWGNGQFVAVGGSNRILTSPDGATWTTRSSGTVGTDYNAVTWGGSQFVVVGSAYNNNSIVRNSPDGVTWTNLTPGTSSNLLAVTWSGSHFVAVGSSGTILTRPGQTPPDLTSPATGSAVSGSSVTFNWEASFGATNYWLQVWQQGSSSYLFNDAVGNKTNQVVSGFPDDGTLYSWRLYAQNDAGWGFPSTTWDLISGSLYNLTVNSTNPTAGVSITSSTGHGGTTAYNRSNLISNTNVSLTTPQYVGSGVSRKSFSSWSGDITSTDRSINLFMSTNRTVTANYIDDPAYTLTVSSTNPTSGISITSSTGHGGTTTYNRSNLTSGTSVSLTAPQYVGSGVSRKSFSSWSGDVTSTDRTINLSMSANRTVTANYIDDPVYTLTVGSTNPTSRVSITSSTGHGGTTAYNRSNLTSGTSVNLTAPQYFGSGVSRKSFSSWSGDVTSTDRTINLTMSANRTVTANYVDDPVLVTTGMLQVTITPQEAVDAGAQWRLTGGSSSSSFASSSLPPEPPRLNLADVPYGAMERNVLRIKFKPEMTRTLDQMKVTASAEGITVTGIKALDSVNDRYGASAFKSMLEPLYDISEASKQYRDRHRAHGLHLWYEIQIDSGQDIKEVLSAYKDLYLIEVAEPVYKIKQITNVELLENAIEEETEDKVLLQSTWTPNDPTFINQWHYHNTGQNSGTAGADIDLIRAWHLEKGNPEVIVAIVDGGIQYNHPDLSANMWPFIGPDGTSTIPDNHGTHVAGTVAAVTNNNVGVAGIAGGSGSGNGVRLMSVDIFDGSLSHNHILIYTYQADNGAAISQNSWGFTNQGVFPADTKAGIDYFIAHGGGNVLNGGLVIFAAGNDNSSGNWYPACYSGVMAVAATNNQDKRASYSNYGTWVEISAPGGETGSVLARGVRSTIANSSYAYYQGTSMACPHVTGVAALMVSHSPGQFTATEIRNMLKETADNHYGVNPFYTGQLGAGRLNAYQALLRIQTESWRNSGETIPVLAPGSYTITFKDVAGLSQPQNRPVLIQGGETTIEAGHYTGESTGSIQVFIEPKAARDAGAQWRLTTGPDTGWKNGGVTIHNLPPGNYTITFKDISGLNTPEAIGLGLEEGENISIDGP